MAVSGDRAAAFVGPACSALRRQPCAPPLSSPAAQTPRKPPRFTASRRRVTAAGDSQPAHRWCVGGGLSRLQSPGEHPPSVHCRATPARSPATGLPPRHRQRRTRGHEPAAGRVAPRHDGQCCRCCCCQLTRCSAHPPHAAAQGAPPKPLPLCCSHTAGQDHHPGPLAPLPHARVGCATLCMLRTLRSCSRRRCFCCFCCRGLHSACPHMHHPPVPPSRHQPDDSLNSAAGGMMHADRSGFERAVEASVHTGATIEGAPPFVCGLRWCWGACSALIS